MNVFLSIIMILGIIFHGYIVIMIVRDTFINLPDKYSVIYFISSISCILLCIYILIMLH